MKQPVNWSAIVASFGALSHDFLSMKAKAQARDKHGRFIKMGSVVRWLDNAGVYHWGSVNKIDNSGHIHVLEEHSSHKGETTLLPKQLEVVKALIPHSAADVKEFEPSKPASHVNNVTAKLNNAGVPTHQIKADTHLTPVTEADHPHEEPLYINTDGFTKVGGQAGSNSGGFYQAPDGTQFYIKKAQTEQHGANEVLAARMYQMAGVNVPDVYLTEQNGEPAIASKVVPGLSKLYPGGKTTSASLAEGRKGFAMDSWLANWDSIGLEYDNMMQDSKGNAVRVDTGGSLLYRAQGSPKGGLFGTEVGETKTLRDPSMNSQAAKIFGGMTDAQVKQDILDTVDKVDESKVNALIDELPFSSQSTKDELKKIIAARKENLNQKFGISLSGPAGQHAIDLAKDPIQLDNKKVDDFLKNGPQTPAEPDKMVNAPSEPSAPNSNQIDAPALLKGDLVQLDDGTIAQAQDSWGYITPLTGLTGPRAGQEIGVKWSPSKKVNLVAKDSEAGKAALAKAPKQNVLTEGAGEAPVTHKVTLSANEAEALEAYVGDDHAPINAYLRDGEVDEHGQWDEAALVSAVDELDSAIAKSTVENNAVVYRGMYSKSDLPAGTAVGTVLKDSGFMSTSSDIAISKKNFSSEKGVLFEIHVPAGAKALDVDKTRGEEYESEFLLPRDSQIQIKEMGVQSDGRTYIIADLLPKGPHSGAVKQGEEGVGNDAGGAPGGAPSAHDLGPGGPDGGAPGGTGEADAAEGVASYAVGDKVLYTPSAPGPDKPGTVLRKNEKTGFYQVKDDATGAVYWKSPNMMTSAEATTPSEGAPAAVPTSEEMNKLVMDLGKALPEGGDEVSLAVDSLLSKAVNHPGDITPAELKQMHDWFDSHQSELPQKQSDAVWSAWKKVEDALGGGNASAPATGENIDPADEDQPAPGYEMAAAHLAQVLQDYGIDEGASLDGTNPDALKAYVADYAQMVNEGNIPSGGDIGDAVQALADELGVDMPSTDKAVSEKATFVKTDQLHEDDVIHWAGKDQTVEQFSYSSNGGVSFALLQPTDGSEASYIGFGQDSNIPVVQSAHADTAGEALPTTTTGGLSVGDQVKLNPNGPILTVTEIHDGVTPQLGDKNLSLKNATGQEISLHAFGDKTFIVHKKAPAVESPQAPGEPATHGVPTGTLVPGSDHVYKDAQGEYVVTKQGHVLRVGDEVTSTKDGLSGTVVQLEKGPHYIKVKTPDGKIKGRQMDTLVPSHAVDEPAMSAPSPSAPTSPGVPTKGSDLKSGDQLFNATTGEPLGTISHAVSGPGGSNDWQLTTPDGSKSQIFTMDHATYHAVKGQPAESVPSAPEISATSPGHPDNIGAGTFAATNMGFGAKDQAGNYKHFDDIASAMAHAKSGDTPGSTPDIANAGITSQGALASHVDPETVQVPEGVPSGGDWQEAEMIEPGSHVFDAHGTYLGKLTDNAPDGDGGTYLSLQQPDGTHTDHYVGSGEWLIDSVDGPGAPAEPVAITNNELKPGDKAVINAGIWAGSTVTISKVESKSAGTLHISWITEDGSEKSAKVTPGAHNFKKIPGAPAADAAAPAPAPAPAPNLPDGYAMGPDLKVGDKIDYNGVSLTVTGKDNSLHGLTVEDHSGKEYVLPTGQMYQKISSAPEINTTQEAFPDKPAAKSSEPEVGNSKVSPTAVKNGDKGASDAAPSAALDYGDHNPGAIYPPSEWKPGQLLYAGGSTPIKIEKLTKNPDGSVIVDVKFIDSDASTYTNLTYGAKYGGFTVPSLADQAKYGGAPNAHSAKSVENLKQGDKVLVDGQPGEVYVSAKSGYPAQGAHYLDVNMQDGGHKQVFVTGNGDGTANGVLAHQDAPVTVSWGDAPSAPSAAAETTPAVPEEPKALTGELVPGSSHVYQDAKGKYVITKKGYVLREGMQVVSSKDGHSGTIKLLELKNKYAKVKGADGTVKGRQIDTLKPVDPDAEKVTPGSVPGKMAPAAPEVPEGAATQSGSSINTPGGLVPEVAAKGWLQDGTKKPTQFKPGDVVGKHKQLVVSATPHPTNDKKTLVQFADQPAPLTLHNTTSWEKWSETLPGVTGKKTPDQFQPGDVVGTSEDSKKIVKQVSEWGDTPGSIDVLFQGSQTWTSIPEGDSYYVWPHGTQPTGPSEDVPEQSGPVQLSHDPIQHSFDEGGHIQIPPGGALYSGQYWSSGKPILTDGFGHTSSVDPATGELTTVSPYYAGHLKASDTLIANPNQPLVEPNFDGALGDYKDTLINAIQSHLNDPGAYHYYDDAKKTFLKLLNDPSGGESLTSQEWQQIGHSSPWTGVSSDLPDSATNALAIEVVKAQKKFTGSYWGEWRGGSTNSQYFYDANERKALTALGLSSGAQDFVGTKYTTPAANTSAAAEIHAAVSDPTNAQVLDDLYGHGTADKIAKKTQGAKFLPGLSGPSSPYATQAPDLPSVDGKNGSTIFLGDNVVGTDGQGGKVVLVTADGKIRVRRSDGTTFTKAAKGFLVTSSPVSSTKPAAQATTFTAKPRPDFEVPDHTQPGIAGTSSLTDALAKIKANDRAGNVGWSFAAGGNQVEDLDVHVSRVLDAQGKELLEIKFKLTPKQGDTMFKRNSADPAWSDKTIQVDGRQLTSNDKLAQLTGTHVYSGSGGRTFVKNSAGVQIQFHRANNKTMSMHGDNPVAFHNMVQIRMPADSTPADISKAMYDAGVDKPAPATAQDFLRLGESRLMALFGGKTNAWTGNDSISAAVRAPILKDIESKWGVTAKDLSVAHGANGRIELRMPQEVADKIRAKTKVNYTFHSLYGGTDALKQIGLGPHQSLLSTTVRRTEGVKANGMSPGPDINSGGADYLFANPRQSLSPLQGLVFDTSRLFQRMDWFTRTGDTYGTHGPNMDVIGMTTPTSHEIMFKHRLSMDDAVGYIVNSANQRATLIADMKAAGITHFGSRTVEEFIITNPGEGAKSTAPQVATTSLADLLGGAA